MEHIKKIIIIVIVLIILITVALLLVKYIDKKDKQENFENTLVMEITNTIEILSNRNEYFVVKSCATDYLSSIAQKNNEMAYSLLDKNYIEEYNINEENVFNYLDKYNSEELLIDKIYTIQDTEQIYTYFVYGKLLDVTTSNIEEFKTVVRLDKANDVYSVIPYKYIQDNQYSIKLGSTISFEYNKIEDKQYNSFTFNNITEQQLMILYLSEIKKEMKYSIETSYDKLDASYKTKRFSNLEEYKQYVNNRINEISKASVQKYQVEKYEDYTQYICIDQNNNYYIINETYPGQYTIILDTYTIDLPEYEEKYNKANEQQKTAYCIDRFVQAINDDNYKFAYEVLADGFKNNYFKTQESFENYAKQHLLGREEIVYKEFKNEGNIYCTYSVTLKNGAGNSLEKTFILKLGEGTDFELSFNVD